MKNSVAKFAHKFNKSKIIDDKLLPEDKALNIFDEYDIILKELEEEFSINKTKEVNK